MYRETLTPADLDGLGLPCTDLSNRGTDNRDRVRAPLGVVTHTPSVTFAKRVQQGFIADHRRPPTPAELDNAAANRFDAARYQPNYLIGTTGRIFVLDLDHQRASHSGGLALECPAGNVYAAGTWRDWASPSDGSGWRRHGRPGHVVYDYWDATFPGAASPLDVFPWKGSPNDAIGIDLLPDPDTGIYLPVQRAAYVALVKLLAAKHGFPLDERHVTTHTLASPCERGTVLRKGQIVGVHWDPDVRVWPHGAVVREAAAGR